eukprot:11875143-Karenia_brevis.AAC.1
MVNVIMCRLVFLPYHWNLSVVSGTSASSKASIPPPPTHRSCKCDRLKGENGEGKHMEGHRQR